MLVIRREQLAQLKKIPRNDYNAQLAVELRTNLPARTVLFSDAVLMDFIVRMRAVATYFGITEAEPIAQFITLALAVGEAVYSDPEILALLDAPGDQPRKMAAVLEAIIRRPGKAPQVPAGDPLT